jgi:hypothetical protein
VTQAHIEGLRQEHLRQTGSLPTPNQESNLIERFIEDEVLVREAIKMGMDQGDPIVRRRLIQKMEFLLEDFYAKGEPTDVEVQEYFEHHKGRFVEPARVSLTHVFLGRGHSEDHLDAIVKSLLDKLSTGTDPSTLGDPFLLGPRFQQRTQEELAQAFGSSFAEAVIRLHEGVWSGPVESSYGVHLVRIDSKTEARQQRLDEVRPAVLKELKAERREQAKRSEIRRLRDRYDIKLVGSDIKNRTSK